MYLCLKRRHILSYRSSEGRAKQERCEPRSTRLSSAARVSRPRDSPDSSSRRQSQSAGPIGGADGAGERGGASTAVELATYIYVHYT